MYPKSIDINADLGEGIGNEAQLMPLISSCNIACGGHAGDESVMHKVVKLANQHRVKIGAHPSFPDTENFGRVPMNMPCVALFQSVETQIRTLIDILNQEHAILHHVKPHGALYNMAAKDERIATIMVEVMKSMHLPVNLYVPYASVIADIAIKNKIPITYEAFADRNYNDDLTLVSRDKENAVLTNEDAVFQHVYRIISEGKVKTITGKCVEIKAQTFCIHGDNPKAIGLLNRLKKTLESKGIRIQ
ncbi:5-oxoprolinase subunit PxpA [Jejuia pallidilutea]|uniref:Lactam utilization protein LamB n=1 Tax=Jejuia pallidilutea TaxID=504487 RepID=A0A090W788_9FLAO|nr:5-oxoprolinase subunit PxpA [Jejuia pallidilutea]GAL68549.1 lactam utilization protein LamB [Jejuia pallidilutea]GAL72058.1 lactam utilization protein LamB [Jejuia pallidilutea]GAL88425.1 lactam utilization protein LamB [Jejuia pallidilutea]